MKFPLNPWSALGLRPRGLLVFLDFDEGLLAEGIQKFQLVAQVPAESGIALNYLCVGSANFAEGTCNFESDRPPLRFSGRIDAAAARIEGKIEMDSLDRPHNIVFAPFSDD